MISLNLEIIIKLLLIIVCSLIIGFTRGKNNQFAGLKTHLLVGLGAGLSFLIPYIFYLRNGVYTMDLYRMSAQVISGIGFLGAGTIIKSGRSIKGLTTAASLWTTAIISIAIASGLYIVAIFSTFIVLLFLLFSNSLDITRKYSTKNLILIIKDIDKNLETINKFMEDNVILNGEYIILEHERKDDATYSMVKYQIVHRQTKMSSNDIMQCISKYKCISKIDMISELDKV